MTGWQRLAYLNTQKLAADLQRLLDRYIPGPPKISATIFLLKGAPTMGDITVRDDEGSLTATVKFYDAEGAETTSISDDTPPTWESSDTNVVTAHPAADGMSCTFDVGSPGMAIVTVTATETHGGTGDPTTVTSGGTVTVVPGDAVTSGVDFATGGGTPTP